MSGRAVGVPRGEADLEQFGVILTDSLSFPRRSERDSLARYRRDQMRLVREGDRVVGGLFLLEASQYLGGRRVPSVGIHAVAVGPEARGKGAGSALIEATVLELARPGGPAIAALFPATQPIYRRAGFEQAGTYTRYRIPVAAIPSGSHELPIERLPPDGDVAHRRLGPIYDALAPRHSGWVDRTPWFWQRLADPLSGSRVIYAVREGAAITGYLALSREWKYEGHLHHEIECRELLAVTPAALRRLWTLLGDERSLGKTLFVAGPPAPADHLLFLEQPAAVAHQMRWMLRILDVQAAFEARGYPPGLQGRLVLEVTDDLLEQNRGRFTLSVEAGRGQVSRGGEGPAVQVDVRGLAALYSGFLAAEALSLVGMADGSAGALAAATALLSGPAPWLPEIF
jgi:predicted acetyltransferase